MYLEVHGYLYPNFESAYNLLGGTLGTWGFISADVIRVISFLVP